MPPRVIKCQRSLLCGVMMLQAAAVSSQPPAAEPSRDTPSASTEQRVYRGVVGNLLESVPIDPAQRVQLQRANAVVSSPLSGRSLALALGIANPPLMIIGLVWGLWSASHIKPIHQPTEQREPAPVQEARPVLVESTYVAVRADDVHARETLDASPPDRLSEYASAYAIRTAGADAASAPAHLPLACASCYLPMLEPRAPPLLPFQ
jgi:hypothetical protein